MMISAVCFPGQKRVQRCAEPSISAIRADIRETETAYLIEADAPGRSEKDIILSLNSGVLTVTLPERCAEDDKNYRLRERTCGERQRSFRLGEDIDLSKVEAKAQDGVLTVTLPKKAQSLTRSVPVTSD